MHFFTPGVLELLSKVYGGSVGLMVVFLAGQKALTKDDTHEL